MLSSYWSSYFIKPKAILSGRYRKDPQAPARKASRLRRSGYDAAAACLAISPDGKTLASGHNDSTILVWDIPEARRTAVAKAAATPKDLEARWSDLAEADAKKAHSSIWELAAHPEQAVPLLRDRLKPATAALLAARGQRLAVRTESDRADRLVFYLESGDFLYCGQVHGGRSLGRRLVRHNLQPG
jgi:hypothetical protein